MSKWTVASLVSVPIKNNPLSQISIVLTSSETLTKLSIPKSKAEIIEIRNNAIKTPTIKIFFPFLAILRGVLFFCDTSIILLLTILYTTLTLTR